jgi:glycosyltransferase involved in cell wall biosynthesis
LVRTAFVSSYLPHPGGVAAHTAELSLAIGGREIVALRPADQAGTFPVEVHHRIRRDERADYARTAAILGSCVDVVALQHGTGVWGGEDGESILDFLGALTVPSIVTLHDVKPEPSSRERDIVRTVSELAMATVVMTRGSSALLENSYRVPRGRIHVIPHGTPDLPCIPSAAIKTGLGVAGRDVILSFGPFQPDAGYDLVIESLRTVVKQHPSAVYVIVGASDPPDPAGEGDAYRGALEARVARLRLHDHVRIVARSLPRMELIRWLEAADVVVTPYRRTDSTACGTLAYAMGAGRAIVSTSSSAAVEMLADHRGLCIEPDSVDALAAAIGTLLGDPASRAAYGAAAHAHSRGMVWSEVARAYRRLLADVAAGIPATGAAPRERTRREVASAPRGHVASVRRAPEVGRGAGAR